MPEVSRGMNLGQGTTYIITLSEGLSQWLLMITGGGKEFIFSSGNMWTPPKSFVDSSVVYWKEVKWYERLLYNNQPNTKLNSSIYWLLYETHLATFSIFSKGGQHFSL